MKNLNTLIEKIKEIDKALDTYEYRGYTFEEYKDLISKGKHGDRSLRYSIKPGSGGKYIWTNIMQQGIDRTKKMANLLYLEHNNRYSLSLNDHKEIELLIKRLKEIREEFKKNTENFSTYPIQSESIGDALTYIVKILYKYNEERKDQI